MCLLVHIYVKLTHLSDKTVLSNSAQKGLEAAGW